MNLEQYLKQFGQGVSEGGQAAQSSMDMERQARLKELLAGKELAGKKSMLDQLRSQAPEGAAVGVEGLSIHPRQQDQMATQLKQQRLQETQKEHEERAVTDLSKQMEKGGYPQLVQSLKEVKSNLPKPGEKSKTLTGLASFVPTAALPITERLHGLTGGVVGTEPGGQRERQAVETAQVLMRHPLFGSALTKTEKQAFDNALGILNGSQSGDMHSSIRRMEELTAKAMKGIEAGARPSALQTYQQRGGVASSEIQPQQAPLAPDARQARIAELRKKLGK
jgi:hypothetical protein